MTAFVVISTGDPAALETAIKTVYPNDNIRVREATWVVSDTGTSRDVCVKLKIINDPPVPNSPGAGPSGAGVVFAIGGYFGHANPAIWEFMRAKG